MRERIRADSAVPLATAQRRRPTFAVVAPARTGFCTAAPLRKTTSCWTFGAGFAAAGGARTSAARSAGARIFRCTCSPFLEGLVCAAGVGSPDFGLDALTQWRDRAGISPDFP